MESKRFRMHSLGGLLGVSRLWSLAIVFVLALCLVDQSLAFLNLAPPVSASYGALRGSRLPQIDKGSKKQDQSIQILFNYYPTPFEGEYKDSEFVFVAISADGNTQAVRYGPYDPAVIAVYGGKLPKEDVTRIAARARLLIPKAAEINAPFTSCDAARFKFSVLSLNDSPVEITTPESLCLLVMPPQIVDLVEEVRNLWKRLDKSRLAYAYITSAPLKKDFLDSARQNSNVRLIAMRELSRDLRTVIRNASKQTPRFYGIGQAQYNRLLAVTRHPSDFTVVDGTHPYALKLSLARPGS